MNFIKKIFKGEKDKSVHYQFQKFSRGEFKNRAIILAKKTGNKYSILTSYEFVNEIVLYCAEKLGANKTKVTGAIVSTSDFKGVLDFKEIKQFQGVKKYVIDKEMSGNEIVSLIQKFPKGFLPLSFSFGETSLKIKPKSPKSAKTGNKTEEKPKPDFCKITTNDSRIAMDFVFENPDFKKAEINHTYIIKEIKVPEELKKSDDFAKIREESTRKGIIIRETEIDSQKTKKEIEFDA